MRKRLAALVVGGVAVTAAVTAGIASADAGGDPFLEVNGNNGKPVNVGDSVKLYGTCAYDPKPVVVSNAFVDGKVEVKDEKPFKGTAKIADVDPGKYEVVLECDGNNADIKRVFITVK